MMGVKAAAPLTQTQETILRTWETIVEFALKQFAAGGKDGWKTSASPVFEAVPAGGSDAVEFCFVCRGVPAVNAKARRYPPGRRIYEVVGRWGGERMVVERFTR